MSGSSFSDGPAYIMMPDMEIIMETISTDSLGLVKGCCPKTPKHT